MTDTLPLFGDDRTPSSRAFPCALGGYQLLGTLGRGGMGEVFLAKHTGPQHIERLCVIKTLREDLAADPGFVARFLDEARVVVQLQHANLCTVLDVGVANETHFLAMEHIFGINLRALVGHPHFAGSAGASLKDGGLAYFVIHEILEGLDCAHRHRDPIQGGPLNLVHRDVSPHNVMLNYEGEIKLIDFGLALSENKTEQTESNVVMGKVHYMSPEQARGDEVDARSDQFSCAVLAYELLSGSRFYEDKPSHVVWGLASNGGYVPSAFASLSPPVATVLERALSAKPAARYTNCGAFKSALTKAAGRAFPLDGKAELRAFLATHLASEREEQQTTIAQLSEQAANPLGPTMRGDEGLSASTTVPETPPTQRSESSEVLQEATLTDSAPTTEPVLVDNEACDEESHEEAAAMAASSGGWWQWPVLFLFCAALGYAIVLWVLKT